MSFQSQLHPTRDPEQNLPSGGGRVWPIAITVFFVLFISFLVSFAVFASRQSVDLVQSDYYEQEIRYQEQFDRIARTQELGSEAAIVYDAAQACITVTLPRSPGATPSGAIQLYRPSDAQLDQELRLALDQKGQQRVDTRPLRAGLWKVRVRWAVDGREFYLDQPVVVGSAGPS